METEALDSYKETLDTTDTHAPDDPAGGLTGFDDGFSDPMRGLAASMTSLTLELKKTVTTKRKNGSRASYTLYPACKNMYRRNPDTDALG
jgi:hypothetical protein